jgi:predicted RNA-binding protein with RPS1 domain
MDQADQHPSELGKGQIVQAAVLNIDQKTRLSLGIKLFLILE